MPVLDLPDMTLTVSVVVTGTTDGVDQASATAVYSQTSSNPESSNVIDGSGDIDLNAMNHTGSFSQDTDITFNLSGQITGPNGNAVPFCFPYDASAACTITREGGGGNDQITPVSGNSPMQLIIDDEDNDPSTYNYCLTIMVQTPTPILVALDPRIVNR